jgi:branched-chain amino acid transport system permease protein
MSAVSLNGLDGSQRVRGRVTSTAGWMALAAAILWVTYGGNDFDRYVAGLVVIYAISALGLDWIQGRAGQVSIGSAAFMAIGAYVAATASEHGIPLPGALALAAVVGGVVGLVFGLPALRLRGLYLALSTLALQFFTQYGSLEYESRTQHYAGFPLPAPAIGGFTFQARSLFLGLAAVLVLVIVGLRNVYAREPGRIWLAVKEGEVAAAVMGIDVRRWKLTAFVQSSALISFSGGLLAYYTRSVFDSTFTLTFALTFVSIIIIGGLGSIAGVVASATLVTVAPYVLSNLTSHLPTSLPASVWLSNNIYYVNNAIFGILVLAFLLYQPHGLAGLFSSISRRIERRMQQRRSQTAEQSLPPTRAKNRPSPATTAGDPLPPQNVVLQLDQVGLTYASGARALGDVGLAVGAGEIVALIGRNGAGKTSTLRSISGFFVSEKVKLSGEISFAGQNIAGLTPTATARRGIVLVPERDKVFPHLTVAEHFRLARLSRERIAAAEEVFPSLRTRRDSHAGFLSGGERQMLALAVAWCMEPRLLMVDELSLGLAPSAIERLMESLQEFRDRANTPILLVEQNVSAALEVADRYYVIDAGVIVHHGVRSDDSQEAALQWILGQR